MAHRIVFRGISGQSLNRLLPVISESENGERLGPLGSRLVTEVISGRIFCGADSKLDYGWKPQITKNNVVKHSGTNDSIAAGLYEGWIGRYILGQSHTHSISCASDRGDLS